MIYLRSNHDPLFFFSIPSSTKQYRRPRGNLLYTPNIDPPSAERERGRERGREGEREREREREREKAGAAQLGCAWGGGWRECVCGDGG